jgi:hypothetical protein
MGIAEVVMYQAVCDGCSEPYGEDHEIVAWTDEAGALAEAEADNWRKQDDGRLLCFDCRATPGGDIFEEDEAEAPGEVSDRVFVEPFFDIVTELSGAWKPPAAATDITDVHSPEEAH